MKNLLKKFAALVVILASIAVVIYSAYIRYEEHGWVGILTFLTTGLIVAAFGFLVIWAVGEIGE